MSGARSLQEVLGLWRGEINYDSPQAQKLALWYPANGFANEVRMVERVRAHNLTFSGGSAPVASPFGYAFRFDGTDDVADTTDTNVPLVGTGISMVLTMRLVSQGAFSGSPLFKSVNSFNSGIWDWGLLPAGGDSYYTIRNGGNQSPGQSLPVGSWCQYAATCDENATIDYLNGKPGTTQGGIGVGATFNDNARWVHVAGAVAGGVIQTDIADIRVYDKRLTASEAFTLYAPSTRYDLYYVRRRTYFVGGAAAPTSLAFPVVRGVSRRILARQGVVV